MADNTKPSRREFVTTAGLATAGVTIVPRHVLGRGFAAPSDTFNAAFVGVGGMGRSNMANLADHNVVAICDVDWGFADQRFKQIDANIAALQKRLDDNVVEEQVPASARSEGGATTQKRAMTPRERERGAAQLARMKRVKDVHLPKARRHTDYRRMLEQQKDIDGVVVATPDHSHAGIALAAMDLGKHVYVQKPLCWSVAEARQLAKRAKETKVATQMGNQGHSTDDSRKAVELVWAGAVGDVREVHIWTNRPLGYWPQGIPRPAPRKTTGDLPWNGPGMTERFAAAMTGNYPMPEGLAWDLFLGPAPFVEYHPVYHPHHWRGWVDWGVGAIGDMGAHLMDVSMWALDLGYPTVVETVSTPFNGASFPHATMTFYEFPARGGKPPVKLTWYNGGLLPPKPAELGEEELSKEGGALLVGSKGTLMHETYGARPRILQKAVHDAAGTPPQKLPRIANEAHELNWVQAAQGKVEASCPIEYAARLTEVMLLGVVALRAGKKLAYDGAGMRVTNDAAANGFLQREARAGWSYK